MGIKYDKVNVSDITEKDVSQSSGTNGFILQMCHQYVY